MIADDGAMPDIARKSAADLKPLASGLSMEVLDWVDELRMIWASVGLSMNQFATLHPINKGTISRYLNGQRVPRDRWFLDRLLAIQADYGQPVTPAVREHLAGLQLRALEVAHPHEYRVRLVSDELEIALTGKLEAERYARALEEQLADRNRQVSELAESKGRLRTAWDADRVAMQADCERLTREIGEITGQLHLARERTVQAERRCRLLEDVLDHLDAYTPADDEGNTDTPSPSAGRQLTLADSASELTQRGDSAAVLVGRDNEMTLLTGLIRQVARGRGSSVLIEGEPGIGKSALVRVAVAGAPEAGCQVFWGAGDELGQALPLLPFLDGLRVREPSVNPRRNAIARLLRGEVSADRGTDVLAVLAEQLLALVDEQCAVRPVILVVDDLQWADPASVALWGRLARSACQVPLLLVGMLRSMPQRDDLLALRRMAGDAARIQLAGLTDVAVADLVAALAGGRPDGNLLRLAAGAAGNPLYVTELVAALARSSSLIVTETGAAELAGDSAPDSLSAAIADRLGFAAGPVREVLRAAALLGAEFSVPDLAIVLDRGAADLIPAVDEARAAGVLVESGDGLGFRHPLIQATLYDEMPTPVRTAWHRNAGRALAGAAAPVDQVARQMLRAIGGTGAQAEPMEEWMLDWLAGSAHALVGQAPGVAAELLTGAVASSPASSVRHGWLASRLADALYRIGDRAAAEQVAIRALEQADDPDLLVDLHWTLAQCRMLAGEFEESLAALDRALASPGISARHRARLLVLAARTRSNLGEPEKAGQVADSALEAASDAGDNWAMGWALQVLALVTAAQGHLADALPLFDRALTVTGADPALTDLRLLLQLNKAITLGNLDRYEEALAAAGQARRLADQVGTAFRLAQARGALGQLLFETGHWDDALAEVETVHEDLKEPAAACREFGIAAVICFHRGEFEMARRHLAAAVPHARRIGHRFVGPLALARSLDQEQDGALPEALATLTDWFDGNAEELEEIEDLLADAVRLATETGDLSTTQALAEHAGALAAGSEIPHRQANVLYCGGLLNHDAAGLLAAAKRYDDASRPLQKAKALEAAARQFVGAGDRGQARAAFTRAVEVYSSLGAAADVARLQATFRAHGIRRGAHSKHRRARSGWDSLTETEIKIATLVEEGLSNPEIAARLLLSRRTVATHVSHILKKLDVQSRTDIARESALRTMNQPEPPE
jgi:DNA-binding CsgD family transcriptional regulator